MKVCSQCRLEKELSEFGFQKHKRPNGRVYTYLFCKCRQCVRENSKNHRIKNLNNPEYHLKKHLWYKKNYVSQVGMGTTDEQKSKNKSWRDNNPEKVKIINQKKKRRHIENLDNNYIKQILANVLNVSFKDITPELIELKRKQIQTWRLQKQLSNSSQIQ